MPGSFFQKSDVVMVARCLLGKIIVTDFQGQLTSGMIVETEAYAGITDKASHAFGGRRSKRTEVMYAAGGIAYVYLCYGIHHLFNVVTNIKEIPHAVLIRAVEPLDGIDIMLQRRKKERFSPGLTAGPGAMSEALGIRTAHTGLSLQGPDIFSEDAGASLPDSKIQAVSRVGVAYAQGDAFLPYRFYISGNRFVSKGKGL